MTNGCLNPEEPTRAAPLHALLTDQIREGKLYQGFGQREKDKERFPIWFYFKNKTFTKLIANDEI